MVIVTNLHNSLPPSESITSFLGTGHFWHRFTGHEPLSPCYNALFPGILRTSGATITYRYVVLSPDAV